MTRKQVGLAGSVSSLLVSMIMVSSILACHFSISFPSLRFDPSKEETAVPKAEKTVVTSAEEEPVSTEPEELEAIPSNVSGLNKASFTASLYGSATETDPEEVSTLTSLVLASHLSSEELGTFSITYSITPEEYEMLLYCVEFETRNGSLEHKALITQVIMNRVQGERFYFSTVKEVLASPGQFDVMPGYEARGEWTPSEVTRQAVDLVLSGVCPDYAQGALYFCNPYLVGEGNWFDLNLEVVCEIEGHRFYR